MKVVFCLILFVSAIRMFCADSAFCRVQDPNQRSERGITSYEKGAYQEAVDELLEATKLQKNNLTAWHYLGLSLEKLGHTSEAMKAHEKTAKLGESLLVAQWSKPKGSNYVALLTSINPLMKYAARSSQKFLELNSKLSRSNLEEWSQRSDYFSDLAELFDPGKSHPDKVFSGTEVTTKARILSKPAPQYTEEALQTRTTGTVRLGIILASDGRVRAIFPIRSLPHGLTGSAIRAARQIGFTPARKDGEPVSLLVVVEYYFESH